MTNPMIREHNTETDEIIDREMTDAEAAAYTATVELIQSKEAEAQAKAAAKAAVLEKLGLTEEEFKALA